MSNNDSYGDVPELGDRVTFVSTLHRRTRGRIIYRDGSLIRILPRGATVPVDFPLDPATGLFDDAIGVQEILIHEKRRDPHFSIQLGVFAGDVLDLLDAEGHPLPMSGAIVAEVIADERDALKLHDGSLLNFNFLGPSGDRLAVVLPRPSPAEPVPAENEGTVGEGTVGEEEGPEEEDLAELDLSLLPAALVEEVESADILYSDTVQREDMFNELLLDLPEAKQRDKSVMANLYRTVDLMMAMKQSILPKDKDGGVLRNAPPVSFTAETIQESVRKQPFGAPIAAVVPVIGVKKVLYMDQDGVDQTDVVVRRDVPDLRPLTMKEFTPGPRGSVSFGLYTNELLESSPAFVSTKPPAKRIQVDQDVFRSQLPPTPVEGLPNKGAPKAFNKKSEPILLHADAIGSIEDRTARLIASTYIVNPKTDESILVSPADTADAVGYVLLSTDLARTKAPIRSSVLLWDIEASERSRSRVKSFYSMMKTKWEDQRTLAVDEETSLVDALTPRLGPEPNLWNRTNTYALDSLGLRSLELTEELMTPLTTMLEHGRTAWDAFFETQTTAAALRMEQASVPIVEGYASADSAMFPTENEVFKALMMRIKGAEPSLSGFDLALANHLTSELTVTEFWHALVSQSEGLDDAEKTYLSEQDRQDRITAVQRARAKEFTAKPVLNACPHRVEYEKVMAVRDDKKRMMLFEPFLNKYRGAAQGNWIQCNRCSDHLICKHELLLLQEFKHPERSESLHKTLLLEFMSPFVFEGSFICKNCGQKIQDIEFDNHIEWGANGPMTGRAVVEEDELDVPEEEEEAPVPKEDMPLYRLLRSLFEPCGLYVELEAYQRSIHAVKDFMKERVKSETAYAQLTKMLAAKKQTFISYEQYKANNYVGILGAVVLLELQTFEKEVTIPSPICKFSADGFPRDGKSEAIGTGALHYVSCILASLISKEFPWNSLPWKDVQARARLEEATKTVRSATASLLGWPAGTGAAPPPITHVTELYTRRLTAAFNRKLAAGATGGITASLADRLPSAFRPLPAVVVPAGTAIGNVESFSENAERKPLKDVLPVVKERQFQLTQSNVAAFHANASEFAVGTSCCYRRLAAVGAGGCGVRSLMRNEAMASESEAVEAVAQRLVRKDVTKSAAGTHIFVPWSAPIEANKDFEVASDASDYFPLFLKTCFKGQRYGLPHELGPTYQCRNCGFHYPQEIVFMTPADLSETNKKKFVAAIEAQLQARKEAIMAKFEEQGVVIDETTFKALERKVRERKEVSSIPPVTILPFLDSLQSLTDSADAWLAPTEVATWEHLMTALTAAQSAGLGIDADARLPLFRTFSEGVSAVKGRLRARMIELLGRLKEPLVAETFAGIERLLRPVDGVIHVRPLINLFIISGVHLSKGISGSGDLTPAVIAKWIPNVSSSHKQDLMKIWERYSAVERAVNGRIYGMEDSTRTTLRTALERFAEGYGRWLDGWSQAVRAGTDVSTEEYGIILEWSLCAACSSLLMPEGPLYREAEGDPEAATALAVSWIVDSITKARQTADAYQLSKKQIETIINDAAEKERNKIIAEFDELGDLRQVELVWKRNKVGRWNRGNNLFGLDPEIYEAMKHDREEAGILDPADLAAGSEGQRRELIYQLNQGGAMDDVTTLRAGQDEDEGGVGDE